MPKPTHKTARGIPVDMDELILRNRKTTPVGNIEVPTTDLNTAPNPTVATNTRRSSGNVVRRKTRTADQTKAAEFLSKLYGEPSPNATSDVVSESSDEAPVVEVVEESKPKTSTRRRSSRSDAQ